VEWEVTPEEWRETNGYWLEVAGERLWIESKTGSERTRMITRPAKKKVTLVMCQKCLKQRKVK
jgi:hypothetical protein